MIPIGTKVICNGILDTVIGYVTPEDKENYEMGYRYILEYNGTQSEGTFSLS
jgi:hypothetical protein